jgi:apolipoprotein N-acyltransferase
MLFLAAAAVASNKSTALDKLKHIPPDFWLKVGLAILALILLVAIIRKLAGANKVIVAVVVFLVVSIIGFNWIYERNEPTWATPVVEKLANFFPAKDAYNANQKKPLKP